MTGCSNCGWQGVITTRACPNCGQLQIPGAEGLQIASAGVRLAAYLLENAILAVGYFVIMGIVFGTAAASSDTGGVAALLGFVLMAALVVVFLYFWKDGTTLGKKVLGLYVVDATTGRRVGFGRMALRNIIGYAVSGAVFSVGFIWILVDKDRQGWHDKIATTLVVKPAERRAVAAT